jgi:hypothetical protein
MRALPPFLAIIALLTASILARDLEDLAKIDHFAFGGVGFAGTTSKGELAFRKVISDRTAREEFLKLLATGSPEAQCYALAGLRALNPATYDEKAKRFEKDPRQVTTIGGCIVMKVPMHSVVANISRGHYDASIKNPPPTRPPGK